MRVDDEKRDDETSLESSPVRVRITGWNKLDARVIYQHLAGAMLCDSWFADWFVFVDLFVCVLPLLGLES